MNISYVAFEVQQVDAQFGHNLPAFMQLLQRQAGRGNFGKSLNEHLLNRLIAKIDNMDLEGQMLSKPDLTYAEARDMFLQHDDLAQATSEGSAVLIQEFSYHTPTAKASHQRNPFGTTVQTKSMSRCGSCGEANFHGACRFRNFSCHGCGVKDHIKKVCRKSKC